MMKERQERQIAEIEAIQREARREDRSSPQSEFAHVEMELDLANERNLQTDQDLADKREDILPGRYRGIAQNPN